MELNWLPDHEAVAKIAGPIGPVTPTDEAACALRHSPGMIPAAVDPGDQTIIWADVGRNDLQEWQFLFSLAAIAEKADGRLPTIKTSLRDLPDLEAAVGDTIPPAGFVFHMSRCGSTLLGNVLNRSKHLCAINQPGPLQDGFWTLMTDNWRDTALASSPGDEGGRLLRYLVRAILRRRSSTCSHGFIKFRSWSVLFIDFIQRAFPDVPCLFMYRRPIEVLASVVQKRNVAEFATESQRAFLAGHGTTGATDGDNLGFMAACYANYFRKALAANPAQTSLLNYRDLNSGNLSRILAAGFHLEKGISDLDLMQDEFRYYSKDRSGAKSAFDRERDLRVKMAKVGERIRAGSLSELSKLYRRLDEAPNNLFPSTDDDTSAAAPTTAE